MYCNGNNPARTGKSIIFLFCVKNQKTPPGATPRITPARTGKTIDEVSMLHIEDHPRTHGENFLKSGSLARMRGSPPRMRGKPDAKLSQVPENRMPNFRKFRMSGSPPRMRGKHTEQCIFFATSSRITPAHAGKTPIQV